MVAETLGQCLSIISSRSTKLLKKERTMWLRKYFLCNQLLLVGLLLYFIYRFSI